MRVSSSCPPPVSYLNIRILMHDHYFSELCRKLQLIQLFPIAIATYPATMKAFSIITRQ